MRKTLLVLMIILLASLSACAKKAAVKKVDDPGVLYVQGVDLMTKKKYDQAINIFAKLRESYPFDPIAVVAQVKQADAYFAKKDYPLAASTYEDFVNNYPEDENAPYAMKRLAESYEKELPTIDRDQAIIFKAAERFTYLKNRYPASPYSKDAEEHLKALNQRLASREFYIGEFYYRTGEYNASVMRLEYLLSRYPATLDKEKALHYLAESYRKLDRPDKSQQYRDILVKEFPKGSYAGQAPRERRGRRAKEARALPEQGATASKQTPVVTSPPASFSYEERRKKEIPLVPIAPATFETKESVTTGRPGQLSLEGDLQAARKPESAKDASKGTVSNRPPGRRSGAAPAAEAAATQPSSETKTTSEPSSESADSSTKDGGKGENKGSLGFFSGKGPIEIDGDAGETLDKNRTLIFKGNVIAKQIDPDPTQTFYLFCDILTAYTSEDTKEIDRLEAQGNVKLVRHDQTATAKQASYRKEKDGKARIILKGDVLIFMGPDKLSADTVTYDVDEDRFYVQGDKDKRARATITPKK